MAKKGQILAKKGQILAKEADMYIISHLNENNFFKLSDSIFNFVKTQKLCSKVSS
jgi:hypothetical protein